MSELVQDYPSFIPVEADYAGLVTPQVDLGVSFDEPEKLSYLSTPLHLFRTDQKDTVRYDVVSEHPPLHGSELVNFLGKVAGSRAETVEGVIADWDIVDRAKSDERSDYAQGLVDLHQQMGKPWVEFMKSRGVFLAVVQDDKIPTDFLRDTSRYAHRDILKGPNPTTKDLMSDADIRLDESVFDQLVVIIESEGVEDVRDRLAQAMEREINKRRNPRLSNPQLIHSEFMKGPMRRKKKVLHQVMAGLPDDVRSQVEEQLVAQIYTKIDLPFGQDFFAQTSLLDPEQPTAREKRQDGRHCAEFFTINLRDGTRRQFLDKKTVQITGGLVIQPVLSWTAGAEGKRHFNFERSKQHQPDGITFTDGILGVLLAAYLSPETTEHWPSEMSIRGRRKQNIGAPQVPVLALMRQGELLHSQIISGLESAAE